MTDLVSMPDTAIDAHRAAPRLTWPTLLYVGVLAGAGAGVLVGRAAAADVSGFEDKLVLLLRFMAAMKALMVLGAVGLTQWRLRAPVAAGTAVGYVATLALMAAAPGLIWSLGAITMGAALFHVGLFGYLVLAWRDDAVTRVLTSRAGRAQR